MSEALEELVAALVRLALAITAISLWAYIPYRYAVRPPAGEGFLGTAYALLFPLASLLAAGALAIAVRPRLLSRWNEANRGVIATRWVVGAYAASWLVMGLACVPSLSALAAKAPMQGLFATLHMTAQHVFLGLVALTATRAPATLHSFLAGASTSSSEARTAPS